MLMLRFFLLLDCCCEECGWCYGGGGAVIGLLDVLCAECDGVGDGNFLGECGGRPLDGIILLPYLLVVMNSALFNTGCALIHQWATSHVFIGVCEQNPVKVPLREVTQFGVMPGSRKNSPYPHNHMLTLKILSQCWKTTCLSHGTQQFLAQCWVLLINIVQHFTITDWTPSALWEFSQDKVKDKFKPVKVV